MGKGTGRIVVTLEQFVRSMVEAGILTFRFVYGLKITTTKPHIRICRERIA
jgi:hypothetical protein